MYQKIFNPHHRPALLRSAKASCANLPLRAPSYINLNNNAIIA
jgi:hypothetical protein